MGPKRGPPRRPTVAPAQGSASERNSVPETQDVGSFLPGRPLSFSRRSATQSASQSPP